MAGVGTTKLFENDDVIVWDFRLEPGESTGVHTHTYPYFFQVVAGSTLAVSAADGSALGDIDFPTGSTRSLTIEGDELVAAQGGRVPVTHAAKNIGPTSYHEILVELKN